MDAQNPLQAATGALVLSQGRIPVACPMRVSTEARKFMHPEDVIFCPETLAKAAGITGLNVIKSARARRN